MNLGAEIEIADSAQLRNVLNQTEGFLHKSGQSNTCDRRTIQMHQMVREFLAHAGASPSGYGAR